MAASASRRLEVLQCHLASSPCIHLVADGHATPVALQPCRAAAAAAAPPVVVGGMVMDLQAHPTGPADVQRGGSVPGRVTQSPGGVARNVAEGLAGLLKSAGATAEQLPLLVSAVGDDLAGGALLQHWRSLGLSTGCIARLAGGATPTVSVVFDRSGEVAACVADVALLEQQLLPPLLRQPTVSAALAAAPVVMLDGNLAPSALEEACRQAAAAGVPVWFEPVSVPKSTRAASLLPMLTYISPNEKELAAMAAAARQLAQEPCAMQQQQQQSQGQQRSSHCNGSACSCASCCCSSGRQSSSAGACAGQSNKQQAPPTAGPETALRAMLPDIATLLRAGVQHIVLTLGAQGAALCTLGPSRQAVTVCHIPALPATVVNCSGAGDCLVAGCLFGLAQGLTPEAALAHGVAAATAAVESQSNVPAGLNAAALQRGAAVAQERCRRWQAPIACCCCG